MMVLRQVGAEIASMFAGDAVMTLFAVVLVAIALALRLATPMPSSVIGFGLFAGCVALLITRVYMYAGRSRL